MKIIFAHEAKADIASIVDYVTADNPEAGARVFDKVWKTCQLLGAMPEMGVSVEQMLNIDELDEQIQEIINAQKLLKNVRRFPVTGFDKLIIFYKAESEGLIIVRVLHGSRDIPTIFRKIITNL